MSKPPRPPRSPFTPPTRLRTFFVTSATWERRPLFRSQRMARLFLVVLDGYRQQGSFYLHEFVLMPDHFHLLISVPPGITLERVVQLVKGGFSFRARKELGFAGEVWQRGFADQYIPSGREFEIHRQYIRDNPLRTRLVAGGEAYAYSSPHCSLALDAKPEHLSG